MITNEDIYFHSGREYNGLRGVWAVGGEVRWVGVARGAEQGIHGYDMYWLPCNILC